jgi:hypothetical protein
MENPDRAPKRGAQFWGVVAVAVLLAVWLLPNIAGDAAGRATGAFLKARSDTYHSR